MKTNADNAVKDFENMLWKINLNQNIENYELHITTFYKMLCTSTIIINRYYDKFEDEYCNIKKFFDSFSEEIDKISDVERL